MNVIVKDSQSDPDRAATVAGDLILNDGIDLMVVASTPETTNPVSDTREAERGALRLDRGPVAAVVLRRKKGDPAQRPFQWTYHFFWGLEDIIAVFTTCGPVETNKVVGALWPNDGDGNAWGEPERGLARQR